MRKSFWEWGKLSVTKSKPAITLRLLKMNVVSLTDLVIILVKCKCMSKNFFSMTLGVIRSLRQKFSDVNACSRAFLNVNRLSSEKLNDRRRNSGAVALINFYLWVWKHHPTVGFETSFTQSDSVPSTEVLTSRLSGICHRFGTFHHEQQTLFWSESS